LLRETGLYCAQTFPCKFKLRESAFCCAQIVLYCAKAGPRNIRGHPVPKRIPDKETAAILAVVEKHPEGASRAARYRLSAAVLPLACKES
jgi:hypothetical protein